MIEANLGLCDSFMSIFGYKRTAIKQDNVIYPAAFEAQDWKEEK